MKTDNSIKNKKLLIVGLGRSGIAAAEVTLRMGADVSIQDSKKADHFDGQMLKGLEDKGAKLYLGQPVEDPGSFDMYVLSPGVPVDIEPINEARKQGVEIIGELELAYRISDGHFIGITGTNGKTTTTTLVGEMFKASGRDTSIAGNIGIPVIIDGEKADEKSWLVTEVSSFQLETTDTFRPEVSAILNLTPDHLNRHKTMENYAATKARIFMRQNADQYCVANYDDKDCFALTETCRAKVVPFSRQEELGFGAFVNEGMICVRDEKGEKIGFCKVDELKIPGDHNLENALAAVAVAHFSGIDADVISDTLKSFDGVEHRIENCGEIGGVRFVNDSKGTNTDAAIKAIEAMKENIILIAGGYDKNADYTDFINCFKGRVKHLILMGQTAPMIRRRAEEMGFNSIHVCNDMHGCVEKAWELAERGDTVLLSPACASWDMYDNFEQRGEDFKECVSRLEP